MADFRQRQGTVVATRRLEITLNGILQEMRDENTAKTPEFAIAAIRRPEGRKGPRYVLDGMGDREFIRMNSNSYLGMSLRPEIVQAEENAARELGSGPGAVRFISGSFRLHKDLEQRLDAEEEPERP